MKELSAVKEDRDKAANALAATQQEMERMMSERKRAEAAATSSVEMVQRFEEEVCQKF
jgi:hypothetical protein